jgi:hypothetical protein
VPPTPRHLLRRQSSRETPWTAPPLKAPQRAWVQIPLVAWVRRCSEDNCPATKCATRPSCSIGCLCSCKGYF